MYRNLNSNSWLKKYAGYSKEREDGATIYTFKPDLYDLSVATLEEFEDCFEDEDEYDDLMDGLDDIKKDMRKVDVTASFGVKKGVLSSLEFSGKANGKKVSIKIEFENVGSTKIDTDTLDDILAGAKESRYDGYYGY